MLYVPDEYRVTRSGSLKGSVAGKIFVANFGTRERVRALSRAKLVAAESALILKWEAESKFLALFVEKIHITRNSLSLSRLHLNTYIYMYIFCKCILYDVIKKGAM